ncbi:hypothetical protein LINPERPRIM_LOCUS11843, partial [Linum perenne]
VPKNWGPLTPDFDAGEPSASTRRRTLGSFGGLHLPKRRRRPPSPEASTLASVSRTFDAGLHLQKVKNEWFNRGGLTPLCIDHVLMANRRPSPANAVEKL